MPIYEVDFEELALSIRKTTGFSSSAWLDVSVFLNRLVQLGRIQAIRVVHENELGALAQFDPVENEIILGENTFNTMGDSHRSRFTVVHEISHALLGHSQTRNRMNLNFERQNSAKFDESEANKLAAAILAPFALANYHDGTTQEDLISRFGISRKTAEIRLADFSKFDSKARGVPRAIPTIVIDHIKYLESLDQKKQTNEDDICENCGAPSMISMVTSRKCASCDYETDDYQEYARGIVQKFPRST